MKPAIELLAPAGNLEKLKMALHYGADAVYLAGKNFGLRAHAGNFTLEEMAEGIAYAHKRGKKVYVTVNIIAHNRDLDELPAYLETLATLGPDALIVADAGVLHLARQYAPDIPLHLSTQANTTNWASARFWQEQGVERIVLARELTLEDIGELRDKTEVELETFVHGALCMSYSGRCLLSNYMAGRDANQGACAQACRWKYYLVEEKRPGEYYPIEEDERGSYIFNAQDLCLIEHIPQLLQAGVTSLKIEGRMKSVHYVATVVNAYRKALDAYLQNPQEYRLNPEWLNEIGKVSHRDYTTGFLLGRPEGDHNYFHAYRRDYDFIGLVREYDPIRSMALVEQRNRFVLGDRVEIAGPSHDAFEFQITAMTDPEGHPLEAAPHPHQLVWLPVPQEVSPLDMLRREKPEREEKQ